LYEVEVDVGIEIGVVIVGSGVGDETGFNYC
jgi:hypothetical protein